MPPGLLASLVASRANLGGVTVADVADEFDVELDVATKALALLGLQAAWSGAPQRRADGGRCRSSRRAPAGAGTASRSSR